MAHGEFGGNPTARAMADKVETPQPKRIQNLEIMENDVLDTAAVRKFVAAGASRMGRRDHPGGFAQLLVKGLEVSGDAMNVGETMQIDERRAFARFNHVNLSAMHIQAAAAHVANSGGSCRSMWGNSRANSFAESSRRCGATSV
jgi:hypothetical protein